VQDVELLRERARDGCRIDSLLRRLEDGVAEITHLGDHRGGLAPHRRIEALGDTGRVDFFVLESANSIAELVERFAQRALLFDLPIDRTGEELVELGVSLGFGVG
jgi:hypothetical protein